MRSQLEDALEQMLAVLFQELEPNSIAVDRFEDLEPDSQTSELWHLECCDPGVRAAWATMVRRGLWVELQLLEPDKIVWRITHFGSTIVVVRGGGSQNPGPFHWQTSLESAIIRFGADAAQLN